MAVSATFTASFEQFWRGIDQTERKLGGLGRSSAAVERQFSRLTESYSGQKIIREATLTADAIEKIGGASKLTESELQRVHKVATEATAKLRLMGADVPERLQRLVDASKPVEQRLSLTKRAADALTGSFAQMAGAFAIGNLLTRGVSALTSWGAAAFESAGQITDLANKTGLSVDSIQRMQYVAAQTGSTVEEFTKASFQLGVRLGGGSSSVRAAVDAVGLSFERLREMKPDQQFTAVVEALERIEDPQQRNTAAVDLFGRSAERILPAVAEGYTKIASEAHVSSEAQIRALDRASDAWEDWVARRKRDVTSFLGSLVEADQYLRDLGDPNSPAYVEPMKKGTEATKAATEAFIPYTQQLINAMNEADRLTDAERRQLDAASKLGVSTQDLSAKFGLSEQALRILNEQTRAGEKAAADAERTHKQLAETLARDAVDGYRKANQAATEYLAKMQALAGVALRFQPGVAGHGLNFQTLLGQDAAGNVASGRVTPRPRQGPGGLFEALPARISGINTADLFSGRSSFLGGLGGGFQDVLKGLTGGKGFGGLLSNVGGGIAQGFGNILSGGLSNLLGTGLNFAMKGLGKLFGFGPSDKEKTGQARDQALSQFGGKDQFAALAREAGIAEATLNRLFSSTKVKDFEAQWRSVVGQIERHNDQLERAAQLSDLQGQRQQLLNDAIQRYGFTIEQLGPTMQKQRLAEQAEQLLTDWQLLTESGIDIGTVTEKMADEINKFIGIARKTGTDVPESMRPMLQRMIDMKLLTDDGGTAFHDLAEAGITFGDELKEMFRGVLERLDLLIARLNEAASPRTGSLTIEERRRVIIDPVEGDDQGDDGRGEDGRRGGVERGTRPLARGGLVTRATRALIGEGGEPELVGPVGFMSDVLRRAMAREGGPTDMSGVVAEIQALRADNAELRSDLRRTLQRMPAMMASAVMTRA